MIYLDNAATTLHKPGGVAKSVSWAVTNLSSPGRGAHSTAMRAAEIAYDCRERAAKLFGLADPSNVVITSNATHSLNIAIKSLARPGSSVLVSGYEHNAVIRPLNAIGAKITVARSELYEPETALYTFENHLPGDFSLVVCNHVSNVFGYVMPIDRIATLCNSYGIPLIIDASQSAGVLDINAEQLNATYIAMPGHKGLYGPQGTGLLLCKQYPDTLLEGGTGGNSLSPYMPDFLPDRIEAGTHNMPGIAGLNSALDFIIKKGTSRILTHERSLIDLAASELNKINDVRIFKSEYGHAQSGVLSFLVEDVPCESVAESLSKRGIAVRAGLHCAPEAHKTAGTIDTGTVRMSVSAFNTRHDIYALASAVNDIVRKK